jgi:MFS family permease
MGCKLWAGLLVDRFGAVRLVPLMCLPFGLGLLLLSYSDATAAAVLFMVLMGITIGIYATLSSPFFSELYGTLHLGAIKSMTTAAMVFSSALAPVLMGRMIDLDVSMEAMALVSAAYMAVASVLAFYACRRKLATRAGHA